jgi:secretion/DNA translocation related TadE-like protein
MTPGTTDTPAGGDRGSATVLVLAAAAVTLALGLAAALTASLLLAGSTARTAADLAALAAADAATAGRPACPTAAAVATANATRLVSCAAEPYGGVTVVVEARWRLAGGRPVRARARAEPGDPGGGGPGEHASGAASGLPPARAGTRHPGTGAFARMGSDTGTSGRLARWAS